MQCVKDRSVAILFRTEIPANLKFGWEMWVLLPVLISLYTILNKTFHHLQFQRLKNENLWNLAASKLHHFCVSYKFEAFNTTLLFGWLISIQKVSRKPFSISWKISSHSHVSLKNPFSDLFYFKSKSISGILLSSVNNWRNDGTV